MREGRRAKICMKVKKNLLSVRVKFRTDRTIGLKVMGRKWFNCLKTAYKVALKFDNAASARGMTMKIYSNVDKYHSDKCAKFRGNRANGSEDIGRRLLKSSFSL